MINTYKWNTWATNELQSPEFYRDSVHGEDVLKIASGGKYSYGKWYCDIDDIEENTAYRFKVKYYSENVPIEKTSISAVFTWIKEDGEWLERGYIDEIAILEDGWRNLSRIIKAPRDAASLKIELGLRWPGSNGYVLWKEPCLERVDDPGKRIVRVATTYIDPRIDTDTDMERRLARICKVVDEAGNQGADIICLSETINERLLPLNLEERALPIDCSFTRKMKEKARQYKTYIIYCFYEREDSYTYNTAVGVNREGEIVGKYRKTHLPMTEAEEGVIPGTEYPVFDTDFGKIGILICWDQMFPEPSKILALKGAEIIFVPTAGDGPIHTAARAAENGIYMVISGIDRQENSPWMPSRIINPMGEVIGQVEEKDEGVCVTEIDLNKKFYAYWLSAGPCYSEPRNIYLKERMNGTYDEVVHDKYQ